MRFYKLIALISLMSLAACVKPQNHDSNVEGKAATFYVGEVKATVDTQETIPGFTLAKSRRYNFTACVRDRRTEEALPGAPFVISGGERDLDVHTDKDGCAIWSETVAFDVLANETFIPFKRSMTAKGAQVGSRELNLAINPWGLKADKLKDLDYTSVPSAQMVSAAAVTPRHLFLSTLAVKNAAGETADGSITRVLKVYLDPAVTLTDIDGANVNVAIGVMTGKLTVTAALIESVTSGGQDTKTLVSKSAAVPVKVEDGKISADLSFKVAQGTAGSRYFLAVRVTPVDGPTGLLPFEGLFTLGDLKSITETGSSSAELKSSNADGTFAYDLAVSTALTLATEPKSEVATQRLTTKAGKAPNVPQNGGNGNRIKTFAVARVEPTWSAVAGGVDVTNKRTIMYRLKACINDVSNGGRAASGVEFSIQLADKTWIKRTTSTLNQMEGCLEWEDKITHRYYEPEHFFMIPVTFKHKSGFSETRTYAIDPWQSFRFSADAAAQPEMIDAVNSKARSKSRLLADGIEFNSQGTLRYDVDEFLSMSVIKKMLLRIPLRVMRASNIVDGLNSPNEPLRQGRYLLKAAFVAPVRAVAARSTELLVSPMIGLNRIVDVRGGEMKVEVEFPISDIRLTNARAYLAFELYLIDEAKLPANDPYLLKTRIDPASLIDRASNIVTPTFVGALNMKSEKDSAILIPSGDLGVAAPITDRINSIGMRSIPLISQTSEPLASITVDRLYAIAKKDRQEYVTRMSTERSVGRVAAHANADVVFVNNEAVNAAGDPILASSNKVLAPAKSALKALLRNLNAPLNLFGGSSALSVYAGKPVGITQANLSTFVRGKVPFDVKLATQFCGYFFAAVPRSKVSGLKLAYVEVGRTGSWMNLCIDEVIAHGPDSVFSVDHRIRVLETGGTQWLRGRSLELRTGANVGFAKMDTVSRAWGVGFGTSGLLGELSRRALLGQGNKALKIFTSASGISGVGLEASRSESTSTMVQGGFSFDVGQSLSVEQNELKIKVTKSDECVVIRPRPRMFESFGSSMRLKLFKQVVGADEGEQLMNRALMICNGQVDTAPRVLPERYYTFGFNLSGGNVTDMRNVNNLPWLMSLRGQRDYASFLLIAGGQKTSTSQASSEAIDLGDLPNARLIQAYDQIYAGKMATIPGYITNEPKILFKKVK